MSKSKNWRENSLKICVITDLLVLLGTTLCHIETNRELPNPKKLSNANRTLFPWILKKSFNFLFSHFADISCSQLEAAGLN